jgi:ferric-dicitrate binding protein FerR (iron transport regulator)
MSEDALTRSPDRASGPPDDLVERLVRLADEGPEIPADGAERIKAAIRPAWQTEVRARSRRHLLWAGAGLAAAAGLILALTVALRDGQPALQEPLPVAQLMVVTGEVEIVPPGGSPLTIGAANLGHQLLSGTWLRTNADSRAALELGDGQSLRLDHDSRLRLVSAREVDLDRGAVYVDSGGDNRAGLAVKTSMGVARDIGTQFMVRRAGNTLSVHVREGLVALTRDSQEVHVSPGTSVEVARDGSLQSGSTLAHGLEWAWTQEVAPPFAIEGRSVIAFLDWVSRETGLWVSFADPDVEALAAGTVLHGTIDGLAPAEAPEIVLAGCGLAVSVSSGTLTVSRSPHRPPDP